MGVREDVFGLAGGIVLAKELAEGLLAIDRAAMAEIQALGLIDLGGRAAQVAQRQQALMVTILGLWIDREKALGSDEGTTRVSGQSAHAGKEAGDRGITG